MNLNYTRKQIISSIGDAQPHLTPLLQDWLEQDTEIKRLRTLVEVAFLEAHRDYNDDVRSGPEAWNRSYSKRQILTPKVT